MKLSHARKFAQHVAPHVIRPARIIWNQVIGAIFLLFAVPAIYKSYQFYKTIDTDSQSMGRFIITTIFGVIMAFFGVTSFLRARRLSRI